MNVLVCDDDAATRVVMKRILTRTFDCTVIEAAQGLEALDLLAREPVDVLMLDVQMPAMDGLEMLETIRRSPHLRGLPVVMLTAEQDEGVVKRIIELGISDFILKPLNVERLTQGFERIRRRLGARAGEAASDRDGSVNPRPRRAAIMIADGDAEFRRFFKAVVGERHAVVEAESGARAIDACLKAPPDIVFVGGNLGLLRSERLVQKLRTLRLPRLRIIGLATAPEAVASHSIGPFDGVIARTLVPEAVLADVTRLLQSGVPLDHRLAILPNLRTRMLSAAEQVFGVMMATEIELVDAPWDKAAERCAASRIALRVEELDLELEIRYDLTAGRQIAAAFMGMEPADMTDDDIASVAGELVNVVSARLHQGFQEAGLRSQRGLPTLGAGDPGTPPPPAGESIDAHFATASGAIDFRLRLATRGAAESGLEPASAVLESKAS